MPICNICNKSFPNRTKINGKPQTLYQRKHCLECVPFGTRHKSNPIETNKTCTICKKTYLYKSGDKGRNTHDKCITCISNKRRKETKEKAVKLMGGKCQICNYDKCLRAMHFHHLDPKDKSFTISHQQHRAWHIIEEELKKCILFCRCHSEIEDGLIIIESTGGIEPLNIRFAV